MVLEKVASSLLSFFLTKYIDKVNNNALKMSLFSGTVSLENLSVKKAALMQHKLPFKIVHGTVKKIYVSIPFVRFKSKPNQAEITNILVLGKLSDKTINETEQMRSTQEPELPDEFSKIDSALKEKKVSKFDFTAGLIGAIIENLQIKITNIHVRLEYDVNGITVSVGLIVPLIQVMTIDENGNEISINNSKTKIRKKLILSNLSLYVDTKCEHYKQKAKSENIDFEKLMLDSMKSESHQFILHNFTFETVYEHAKAGQGPVTIGNILNCSTSAIKLALDSFQYQCFTRIMAQQSRYMIKKFFSTCGKPSSLPEKETDNEDCVLWWRFAERCAEKKIQPYKFNPTTALVFLKNRNEHFEKLSNILINPDKKKDEKYLRGLQEQYGGDVFLMFRAYAMMKTEKQLREKKHKEIEEMRKKNKNESDQESKEIQELLAQKDNIKNNADTWSIKLKVNEIDLGLLLTPTKYLAMLEWKAWEGTFLKNKDDIYFEALIGDMSIVNMQSKERTKIIEMIKSEKTKGGSATANIKGNLASRIFRIDSIITSPHLYADLTVINEVQMFLSGSTGIHVEGSVPKVHKRDHTHAEIVNLIDTHSKLFINLHLDSPVVTVPYKMPIQVLLGNVDIKSIKPDRKRSIHDKKSWYDEYSLDLSGFQILLGKKIFCSPVTFSLNCLQSFIRKSSMVMTIAKTDISSMNFGMNHRQYRMLLQLPDYISQFIEKPQKKEEDEEVEKKKENEVHTVKQKKGTIDTVDSVVSDLSIQFNVDFKEFGLKLFKSKNIVGSELKIAGISTGVKALQNKAEGNFVLQYIKVLGNKNQCICSFGDEKDPAINIEVSTKGIEIALAMKTTKLIIDVDFDWLGSLMGFVIIPKAPNDHHNEKAIDYHSHEHSDKKKEKKEENKNKEKNVNQYQLVRKLEIHPIFKIDVVFAGPTINLPCGNSQIIINSGILHLFTKDPIPRDPSNIESFYDMLVCDFSKFEILLGKEYLLDPFSLTVEAHKAFILRHDVEDLKVFLDIHELKVQLKRSQFLSLLSVVDSVKAIILSSDKQKEEDEDSEEEKKKEPEHHHKSESGSKSGSSKLLSSLYANLKFEALVVDLLNEDNSINTGFTITKLESRFNSFQDDINSDLKIVVLKGIYNDETLLSFGEDNTPSFDCNVHYNKDETKVDFHISKPTVLVDLQWIAQLKRFFDNPNKVTPKEKLLQLIDSSRDRESTETESQESNLSKDKIVEITQERDQKKEEEDDDENDESNNKNKITESLQSKDDKNTESLGKYYKSRDASIDSLSKIPSHNNNSNTSLQTSAQMLSEDKEKSAEPVKNETEPSEQNQNQNISALTEVPADDVLTKVKVIEPKTPISARLKNIPLKYASILLIIPLILFRSYFFNFKFLFLLFVVGGGSTFYYMRKKQKNNANTLNDSNEEIKAEPKDMSEEKPIEQPNEIVKDESKVSVIDEPEEETAEESEDKIKEAKSRAINVLATDALKAPEPIQEEVIEEPPEKPLTLLEQLQKVQGTFVITEPSFSIILIKKTQEPILMNTQIKELNLSFEENHSGAFNIEGFQISVDERYLMKPFSINIGLNLENDISIKLDLPAMIIALQTCDYQLLLEIGQYIPAVLNGNKHKNKIQNSVSNDENLAEETTIVTESLTSNYTETLSVQSNQQKMIEYQEEEEEEAEENKKPKIPLVLDVKFQKIELDIFDQKKKIFNFDINSIIVASTAEGKFDLTVTSIICQEHITSKSNTLISFATPTLVNMSETGDISVSISPDATIFIKMKAINALLDLFLPGDQILDFEKPKKIKLKHKHKHKHKDQDQDQDKEHKHKHLHLHKHKHKKEKHDEDDKNHKHKGMMISVQNKCFKVVFLDDSEIATLSLYGISYEKIGINQTVKLYDIALVDPIKSNLHPSEVLSSEKGKVLSIDLHENETSIKINRLIIFANLNVISRVVNTVAKNPLRLPPPPPSEEEDEDENESLKQEKSKDEKTSIDDQDKDQKESSTEQKKEKDEKESSTETKKDKSEKESSTDQKQDKNEKESSVDNKVSNESEKSDNNNTLIVKKDDQKLSQIENDEDDLADEENVSKKKKKNKILRLRFKYISFTVPVSFDQNDEMFDFSVDGSLAMSSQMKLAINHISSKFIQYKGSEHPPFIPDISLLLVNKENEMNLSIKPTLISVALDDIVAASVLSGSLSKFVSNLNLPHNDDGIKKSKKKESEHKMQQFSLSVNLNKFQLILNSDRYQTVPLFRLIIKEFEVAYSNLKPSQVHCVFDSIDFMDIQYLTWKMLLESFSLNVSLMINDEIVSIDTTIEQPININCAYQAIQMLLSHIKTISKTVSSKQLIDSKPPTFKVANNCSKVVTIKRTKNNESFDIDPVTEQTFDFSRDDELEVIIGEDSRKIVTSKLQFPIFVDFQAVSQNLLETGTTLKISSILLFMNQTKHKLNLFQQQVLFAHEKLLELPPGKQIPFTDFENLRTMSFVLSTEETLPKTASSTFLLKEVKRRAVLLNCQFPNKKKLKLVVISKFDPLTCSMVVKIQPNCVIRNQLPLDLFIRADGNDEILHLKPGETVKTTVIDASGLEFTAYFATSSFGENIDDINVTAKSINNKVKISTTDGFISSVPLVPINATSDDKKTRICFAIEAKRLAKKPQYELVCFAPSIIFNQTGIELSCYTKVLGKKTIMETFSPREKDSDPNQNGCLIWSSEEYFKNKDTSRKLSLQISASAESERKFCYENIETDNHTQSSNSGEEKNYMGDDVIECLATHINGPIMLPTENPDIFIPLHYSVSSAQPYASSTLVTLSSLFAICNSTSQPFYIHPVIIPKPPEKKVNKIGIPSKKKKNKDQNSDSKGVEVASEETERENDSPKKTKKKKKFHLKMHKKDHGKTSEDTDNETVNEADDEETSKTSKKSKKKHFHLKSHKDTHAKTDTENDVVIETDDETNKETEKTKKRHSILKSHKDKHAKTDNETNDDEETSKTSEKSKKKHFHLKSHKETHAKTDTEIKSDTDEDETSKTSRKSKKKKLFHLKHKDKHAKTDNDNKTGTENEAETETEADDETSTVGKKSKKKKRFHLKLHKITRAKTDVENDDEKEVPISDEMTEIQKKKKKKTRKVETKSNKRKITKNKKSDEDITSDLESITTTTNDNENDDDDDDNDNDDYTSSTTTKSSIPYDPKKMKKLLKFGDSIKVENTGKPQQVRLASEGLLFAFKVDQQSSKYTLINFSEPIHTTFALEGQLFEIENQAFGAESLIVIKEAVFPQPINLLNDLRIGSHDIYLTQKSANEEDIEWKSKATPQSMTIVAYDVPFGGTDLILHYKNHKIPINLIHVNTSKKKHHIYYEVIVNKNSTKTIVVSKIPYQHPKKANLTFHVNIPVITISLIDKLNREFALLTLQRLEFGIKFGKFNSIMFNMGAFQLDDLQPSSMLKVVIAAYPDVPEGEDIKSKNLIEFSASMYSDTPLFTACKDLSFKCDPIILFIDLSFLSDAITLMQSMFLVDDSNNSTLLTKPKQAEASSLSSIPLTAESLTIGEIKFTVFVRAHSSRPNLFKSVSYFLRAVPDITNGSIVLPSFHFEDCTMNQAYIQKEIVHPLIEAGIKQGLKLLFNTDIFMRSTGTKSASFAKKGEKLMNGQLQVLVQVPGSMILQGGETGLNVASKFLHNITFSKGATVNRVNATAKDTMNSGVKALGHGFADAVTGLVKDPMKEKDKKGVGGVFVGIGKGLLGLITKPIAGILDASVASISAMRKKLNGEDADVIPPIRIAHALPMIELTEFDDKMMVAKDVAQLSFQLSDITELYNQYVERYVIDNETSELFGVTQEYMFTANKDGILVKKARIKNITEIHWDKETHIISMSLNDITNKLFEIHINEQERAVKITEMINSRRIALGIGE